MNELASLYSQEFSIMPLYCHSSAWPFVKQVMRLDETFPRNNKSLTWILHVMDEILPKHLHVVRTCSLAKTRLWAQAALESKVAHLCIKALCCQLQQLHLKYTYDAYVLRLVNFLPSILQVFLLGTVSRPEMFPFQLSICSRGTVLHFRLKCKTKCCFQILELWQIDFTLETSMRLGRSHNFVHQIHQVQTH